MDRTSKILIVLIIVVATTVLVPLITRRESDVYPNVGVRRAVAKLEAKDIAEISISLLPTVTNERDIEDLLGGLKVAEHPMRPELDKQLLNKVLSVKLLLKNGKTVGPFYFAIDGPKYAFSYEFARAFNRLSPELKVKDVE